MKICNDIQNLIPVLLQGECSSQEELAIRTHFSGCTECTRVYEALQSYLEIDRAFISSLELDPADGERMARKIIEAHNLRNSNESER